MTDYLTVADVLAMHADQIERYGGSHGVRDLALLEAAVFRPQSGYYGDLIEEAAALWESLIPSSMATNGRHSQPRTRSSQSMTGVSRSIQNRSTGSLPISMKRTNSISATLLIGCVHMPPPSLKTFA